MTGSSNVYGRRVLVGRDPERALLRALVEQARHGSAGTLIVRGEPGVGKSALLDDLASGAREATLLRTQGLEVEAPLAFAALHRLLRPLTRLRDELPLPQARALRVAFGEDDGPSVEPFLVGVATLSLLTAAAEENLVLCVVDDAHWLDPATAGALLFCARRLGADRVAMVFAARDGGWEAFDPQGLSEMVLTGLEPDAARALLDVQLGDATAENVTQRLIVETRGNPLALLELPSELSAAQLRGSSALPAQLHLTARVEQVFLDRSRRLPRPVQSLLLLAAADDTGELDVLRRASAGLGLEEQALEAALESGLLVGDAKSVTVRHPLMRSAIYQAATGEDRRRSHRALAEALAGSGDPDRETWHRASAAEGPDQEVVSALELVGSRAQRRGGYVAALAAYERAAALSTDPAQRADLTFAAARSAWACGRVDPAQVLLASAREGASDPLLLCDIARLRGHIEVNLGSATEAHRIFVEAAQAVYHFDPVRALEIGVAAALIRTYGADSGTPLPSRDLLAVASAGDSPRTTCLRQMLISMTRLAEGNWAAAVEALKIALAIGEQVDDRDVLWNLGNAALQVGDDEAQQRFYSFALSRAREAGAVTAVVYCLQRLCFCHFLAGDYVAVRGSAEEALALGVSIGQPALTALPIAWLTLLAARQDRDDYDQLLLRLDELVAAHPLGILTDPVHDLTRWGQGVRAAATGDSFGALHQLSRFRLPVLARMAAPERIEAAVRVGETEMARGWIEELAGFAEATSRPWALATVAFGRALMTDPSDADSQFGEALAQHARAGRPLDEARTHLAYGEWLRRSQRRVDARQHLRHALETFQDLRVEAMAARANQELRASGETARKRDPSTLVKLTPMELKIAQLVSSGLSNKDVAAQCWISPRTVAFHLRNVFTKAGVTSRGELAQLDLA
jgi:DNA-binding CsgD family transcriptional regulator/tetratricopeptide (TPR) repeat protein